MFVQTKIFLAGSLESKALIRTIKLLTVSIELYQENKLNAYVEIVYFTGAFVEDFIS